MPLAPKQKTGCCKPLLILRRQRLHMCGAEYPLQSAVPCMSTITSHRLGPQRKGEQTVLTRPTALLQRMCCHKAQMFFPQMLGASSPGAGCNLDCYNMILKRPNAAPGNQLYKEVLCRILLPCIPCMISIHRQPLYKSHRRMLCAAHTPAQNAQSYMPVSHSCVCC